MKLKLTMAAALIMFAGAELAWACNPATYVGCSPEELRAIQQQQFYGRKRQPVSSDDYWRDRQYVDRLRQEDRNHDLEIEKLRSRTAVEVARQERRSWRRGVLFSTAAGNCSASANSSDRDPSRAGVICSATGQAKADISPGTAGSELIQIIV